MLQGILMLASVALIMLVFTIYLRISENRMKKNAK